MKRFLALVIGIIICTASSYAACNHSHCRHSHGCRYHNYSHSSSDSHVYLISKDYKKTEEKFVNCDKHYMVVETFTNYYSNGTRRVFQNCTIYNADGTTLQADCQGVKHIIYNKEHYFIIRKGGYSLMNSEGNVITKRIYSRMEEICPNRFLVRYDKKYGIIDINEKTIAEIKYKSFKKFGKVFITKLNGYYGIINADGETLVYNDCEKIKPLFDTAILKKYGKYGLADIEGKIIIEPNADKIKHLGEYIVVRTNKKYQVYDYKGALINNTFYEKIRLKRNRLQGFMDKTWVNIENPALQTKL